MLEMIQARPGTHLDTFCEHVSDDS